MPPIQQSVVTIRNLVMSKDNNPGQKQDRPTPPKRPDGVPPSRPSTPPSHRPVG